MRILRMLGLGRSRRALRGPRRARRPAVEGMETRALLATTATITQTLTLAPTPTSFGTGTPFPAAALSPALNLFNPALGTLVDVRVSAVGNVTGQLKAENTSRSSGTTVTGFLGGVGDPQNTDASFQVTGLNFTLAASNRLQTQPTPLAPFDGNVDYSPPSGVTFPPLVISDALNTTFTDTASLAFYTAMPGHTALPVSMSTQASAFASAPGGNLQTAAQTTGEATITVSYDYVPGPPTLQRFGVHRQRTSLVVTLNTPVSPLDAQNVDNYKIISPGRDRRFGTRDDVVDPINVATYNATTNVVTLIPVLNLNIHQPYRLVLQYPGQTTPTVIPFNHRNLAGFNYHGGKFFAVVDGRVVR